jgi:hypothetical protein
MQTHRGAPRIKLATVCFFMIASLACNFLTNLNQSQPAPTTQTAIQDTPVPQDTPIPQGTPVSQETQAPAPTEAAPTQTQAKPTPPPGAHGRAFGSYPAVEIKFPASYEGGYTLPVDLGMVKGLDIVQITQAQQQLLAQNGFVVAEPVPGKYKEFYQVYESQRYEQDQPLFVTTDALFHVYHLVFDKMLRDLETTYFIPALQNLTQAMLQTSQEQYTALKGTALEEPARRNLAYFAVAAQLLGLKDPVPGEVKDLVNAEMALIDAHSGPAVSPIWDRADLPEEKKLKEDYSQYIPRGHYTRSEDLKRYFRSMMWYGRMTYRLRDPMETRRALLMVQAIRKATGPDGTSAQQLWENIYEPTAFIVGKADDLSFQEWGAVSDAVYGQTPDLKAFADDALLAQFTEGARQLPPPQVNSMWVWIWEDRKEATQGFRFMGQRFTLDEYVFGQLMWRKVGTLEKPRDLPKGLDFFASLGSDEALGILNEMGENSYPNYSDQMNKVKKEVATLGVDSWTQNLYWSWLYSFQPVIQPKDERYPLFMRSTAWVRKSLNTVLGSWTELKHDTILYAKQVMAEMGGGAPLEPPHGYVEPDPEAYGRLWSLAKMTYDGLQSRSILPWKTKNNLENLMDLLQFLKASSERELAGKQLSDDDYWRIQYIGGELEALTIGAADCDGDQPEMCRDLQNIKSPLVADVATGMGRVLEEGTGQPTEIYVVLPDQPYRIGVGAVYTYYEFPVPPDQRMTDEQWQALVEGGKTPDNPGWTGVFMTP